MGSCPFSTTCYYKVQGIQISIQTHSRCLRLSHLRKTGQYAYFLWCQNLNECSRSHTLHSIYNGPQMQLAIALFCFVLISTTVTSPTLGHLRNSLRGRIIWLLLKQWCGSSKQWSASCSLSFIAVFNHSVLRERAVAARLLDHPVHSIDWPFRDLEYY